MNNKIFIKALISLLVVILFITGCADNSKVDNKDGSGIHFAQKDITLSINGEMELKAIFNEGYENLKTEWTVEDSSIIKLIVLSSTKLPNVVKLKATKIGSTTLTAKAVDGKVASIKVVVTGVVLSSGLENNELVIKAYEKNNYQLSITSNEGNVPLVYSSKNLNIATVSDTGLIDAKKGGETIITVKHAISGAQIDIKLTVFMSKFEVKDSIINCSINESVDLQISGEYDDVEFESLNPNIASVDQKGTIKGLSEGVTYISINDNGKITKIKVGVYDEEKNEIILSLQKDSKLNYFGRTMYDEALNAKMFYHTTSGFEISFYGTELKADMLQESIDADAAWLSVFVDGEKQDEEVDDSRIVKLTAKSQKTYSLVEGLTEGYHTVKVLKRTAYLRGHTQSTTFGVCSINTDGYFIYSSDPPSLKIEVYGDSISDGYGNLTDGKTMTSENTNGILAYHSLLANSLGAQLNVMSASGWGLYKDNEGNFTKTWANRYNTVTPKKTVEWDFTNYLADIVIINLGANDNTGGVFTDQNTTNGFIASYNSFISKLREHYPNAKIICTYGMTSKNASAVSAIERAAEGFGDEDVYTYFYKKNSPNHPLVENHKEAATELYNFIMENKLL